MSVQVFRPAFCQRRNLARAFAADQRGSVAIIFGLTLMGVIMFVACAVDITRLNTARTKLTAATDAATIFAAKELKTSNQALATIVPMARTLFDQNMVGAAKLLTVTSFSAAMTPDGNGVTISVKAELPTTFARVAGITKINVPQTSTAVFNSQDIEVSMQLDVTGSMGDSVNGVRKIDSLKASTKTLLDILLPDNGSGTTKIRVGVAPFSAGVNAGSYARSVAGIAAPGNCVYERRARSADGTDVAPTGSDALLTLSDLPRGSQPCPSNAQVIPLTTDKAKLLSAVNGYTAGGTTAGHLGTSWAWYLLSPTWASIWPSSAPAAYNTTTTRKIAILETDGIYNTVNGNDLGDYSSTAIDSQTRAKATCQAMRDAGITIYAVGFIKAGEDPAAANTLQDCVGPTGKFYYVQDGEQLNLAFLGIAQDISNLRLSQ